MIFGQHLNLFFFIRCCVLKISLNLDFKKEQEDSQFIKIYGEVVVNDDDKISFHRFRSAFLKIFKLRLLLLLKKCGGLKELNSHDLDTDYNI